MDERISIVAIRSETVKGLTIHDVYVDGQWQGSRMTMFAAEKFADSVINPPMKAVGPEKRKVYPGCFWIPCTACDGDIVVERGEDERPSPGTWHHGFMDQKLNHTFTLDPDKDPWFTSYDDLMKHRGD
jgi:hypothetical protein